MIKIQLISISLLLLTLTPAINDCSPAIQRDTTQIAYERIIREATILIEMQLPVTGFRTSRSDLFGYGIGTLIQYQGEILLVTHNHWSLIEDSAIIRFYDADYQLIKTIIGKQFRAMIAAVNAGTMLLRPPQEIIEASIPVSPGNSSEVAIGDLVEVVYRENPAGGRAAIQQAIVEAITTYQDLLVYKLRSLDGKHIQPGDSGGGIWHKGNLIGNNWMVEAKLTLTPDQERNPARLNRIYTATSIGAALAIDGELLAVNGPTQTAPIAAIQLNQAEMARLGLQPTQSNMVP